MTLTELLANPLIAAVHDRDEKAFFGQGWSHYPKAFTATAGGIDYALSVYNTPSRTQVNWHVCVEGQERSYLRRDFDLWAMTPEESRELAAVLGLDISAWLAGAMEACRTDVTHGAERGEVISLDELHMVRSFGVEDRG